MCWRALWCALAVVSSALGVASMVPNKPPTVSRLPTTNPTQLHVARRRRQQRLPTADNQLLAVLGLAAGWLSCPVVVEVVGPSVELLAGWSHGGVVCVGLVERSGGWAWCGL